MTRAMVGDRLRIGRSDRDDAAKVVIRTGAPGTFCAGIDLADLQTVPGAERVTTEETEVRWPVVPWREPVISAIEDRAVAMVAEPTSPIRRGHRADASRLRPGVRARCRYVSVHRPDA